MQRQQWRLPMVLACMLLASCSSEPGGEAAAEGKTTEIYHNGLLGMYRALVYEPASAGPQAAVPMVVVLHGANTTAEQQRAANLFDPIADREGFITLYPDHETDSQLGLHPLQSWRFYNPLEMQRGVGDAEAIAALTQQAMQNWNVDPERVYVVGMSAGGFMTSILGATYPDLYAAIGVAEAGGYGIGFAGLAQPLGPLVLRPELTATLAYQAMGAHARIVPMIQFQGDQDAAVLPETGAHAVQQWLMTNNLVASGNLSDPFPLTPSETTRFAPEGRYPYEVDVYRDADGCRVVEQVRIEGMEHYWPGGSDDPAVKGFTDPLAPSGAEMSWAFFKRFRRSETSLPCTEAGP